MRYWWLFGGLLSLVACSSGEKSEEERATEAVDSFAVSFYNLHYGKALALCDEASVPVLQWYIANLEKEDMDVVRNAESGADVKIEDTDMGDEDTTALVSFSVKDFFVKDSVGLKGRIETNTLSYTIPVRKVGNVWKVVYKEMKRTED